MAASTVAPDSARLPELQKLVKKVLSDVRSGHFGPMLTKNAESVHRQYLPFREADELGFARSHSLHAEVLDQAGKYQRSLKLLESLCEEYLKQFTRLTTEDLHQQGITEKERLAVHRLARQKVMCCLAYGFAAYRIHDYEKAKSVLDACAGFLNKKLIHKKGDHPFFCHGTLARLHYFYGQLFRAQRDFVKARENFVKALECANERISFRREEMERSSSKRLASDQLFANHCAGKVLGFGLGWTYLLQGELSKAAEQLQAARVLLADSNDEFLKWQVELLSCSVLRSQKGNSTEVAELIPRIEKCYKKLEPHTEYGLQARREFVKAHLSVAQAMLQGNAEKAILLAKARQVVRDCQRIGKDSKNNQIYCLVLTSRIERAAEGDMWSDDSYKAAKKAYDEAKMLAGPSAKGLGGVLLEATIALGEIMGKSKEIEQRIEARKRFEEAIRDGKDNPLVRCASYLHLAEIHLGANEIMHATARLEDWRRESFNVEHQWLRQKADILEAKLANDKVFIVGPNDARKYEALRADLRRFLLNRERMRQAGQDFNFVAAAQEIGVEPSVLKNWARQTGAQPCVKCKRFFCVRHPGA